MTMFKEYFTKSISERRKYLTESDDKGLEDAVMGSDEPQETIGHHSGVSADEADLDNRMTNLANDTKDSAEQISKHGNVEGEYDFSEMKNQIEQSIEYSNNQLATWADKVHEFLVFVNDSSDPDSIRASLDASIPGSPMETLKGTISNQLKRVASQLASLEQELRGEIGGTSVQEVMDSAAQ